MADQETFLGDGVYVALEQGGISLRASREGGDHVVYLNATVLT